MTSPHPPHRDLRLVVVVGLGGAVGTGARYLTSTVVVPREGWPVATFLVNVLGAFLLGLLLEVLARRGGGAESVSAQRLRLGLGTGLLGGFTTYSSVAIELERMLAADAVAVAASYAVATLLCGVLAALLGVGIGARRHRHDSP